jgi:hypothetical protein
VIHEVDDALRRLVREEVLRGSAVEVALDAPSRDWSARRNAPTVNMYLYDIREDLRRRQRGIVAEQDAQGRVTGRRPPPRFIKLSYLVTAWTQRPEDEHRLLATLLAGLLRCDAVPDRLLTGSLAALGIPVPLTVAQPPPEDRSFADVWTALGGELKPSLDVVVSAPIEPVEPSPVGPPVTAGMMLDLVGQATGPPGGAGHPGAAPAGAAPRADGRVGHHVDRVDVDRGDDTAGAGAAPGRLRVAMRRVRP